MANSAKRKDCPTCAGTGTVKPKHEHTNKCYDYFAKPEYKKPDCGYDAR